MEAMRFPGIIWLMLGGWVFALPAWKDAERKQMIDGGWIAGESLFAAEPLADSEIMDPVEPTAEELALDQQQPNYVDEKFVDAYFSKRPDRFLVDPQGLIPDNETEGFERFLNYHADDSEIDLFVYVFGANQEISSDIRVEEMPERLFSSGKSAVMVFYYLGAPSRAAIFLSPKMTDSVSAAEQRRALESSLIRSMQSTGSFHQLEEFLIQMSVRAYWMERMIDGTASETMDTMPSEASVVATQKKQSSRSRFDIPAWAWEAAWIGGGGLVFLAGVLGMIVWLHSRKRYTFPKLEVEQRLGGEHAAGIGALVSFSNSSLPPAKQRDQVSEIMRRA